MVTTGVGFILAAVVEHRLTRILTVINEVQHAWLHLCKTQYRRSTAVQLKAHRSREGAMQRTHACCSNLEIVQVVRIVYPGTKRQLR